MTDLGGALEDGRISSASQTKTNPTDSTEQGVGNAQESQAVKAEAADNVDHLVDEASHSGLFDSSSPEFKAVARILRNRTPLVTEVHLAHGGGCSTETGEGSAVQRVDDALDASPTLPSSSTQPKVSSHSLKDLTYNMDRGSLSDSENADGDLAVQRSPPQSPTHICHSGTSQISPDHHPLLLLKKTKKSEEQIAALLRYYKQDSKPHKSVHHQISQETGLTVEEVVNWFRNRRSRHPQRLLVRQQHQNHQLHRHNQGYSKSTSDYPKSPLSPVHSITRGQQHRSLPLSQSCFSFTHDVHQLPSYPLSFPEPVVPARSSDAYRFPVGQTSSHGARRLSLANPFLTSNTDREDSGNVFAASNKPLTMPAHFARLSPMDMVNRANDIQNWSSRYGIRRSSLATPGHTPTFSEFPSPVETTAPDPISSSLPLHPRSETYAMDTENPQEQQLSEETFLAVFHKFSENGIERQRMLQRLISELSPEEQGLALHELHIGNRRRDCLKPMEDRAKLAWDEMHRLFKPPAPMQGSLATQRLSMTSLDSGAGGESDGEYRVQSAHCMQQAERQCFSDSASTGTSSGDSGISSILPRTHSATIVSNGQDVIPDLVTGLATMLKAHQNYILPVFEGINLLLTHAVRKTSALPANNIRLVNTSMAGCPSSPVSSCPGTPLPGPPTHSRQFVAQRPSILRQGDPSAQLASPSHRATIIQQQQQPQPALPQPSAIQPSFSGNNQPLPAEVKFRQAPFTSDASPSQPAGEPPPSQMRMVGFEPTVPGMTPEVMHSLLESIWK